MLSHLQRFLAPRDVENTALLTWEAKDGNDDQWLYLPATRNPKRIAAAWASRTMHNGIPDTEVRTFSAGLMAEARRSGVRDVVQRQMFRSTHTIKGGLSCDVG